LCRHFLCLSIFRTKICRPSTFFPNAFPKNHKRSSPVLKGPKSASVLIYAPMKSNRKILKNLFWKLHPVSGLPICVSASIYRVFRLIGSFFFFGSFLLDGFRKYRSFLLDEIPCTKFNFAYPYFSQHWSPPLYVFSWLTVQPRNHVISICVTFSNRKCRKFHFCLPFPVRNYNHAYIKIYIPDLKKVCFIE